MKQAYEVLTDEYQKVVYDMQIRLQGPGGGRGSSTVFTKWYDRELERERERLRYVSRHALGSHGRGIGSVLLLLLE